MDKPNSHRIGIHPFGSLAEGQHNLFVQTGKEDGRWSESATYEIEIDLTTPNEVSNLSATGASEQVTFFFRKISRFIIQWLKENN